MKRSLLFLLLLAAPLFAAPPTLEIPSEVKPAGGYARMTPKGDAVSVIYVSLDGLDPFPSEELRDPRRFLLPVAGVKAGRYRFVAVGASKDGEQARVDFVVVVGDAPAPVPPGPGPAPVPPGPSPKVDRVWVVVVEETATRTQKTAGVLNDVQFWRGWDSATWGWREGLPGHWRFYDKDSPAVPALKYDVAIRDAKVPLPAILLISEAGAVLKCVPLPDSTAGVKALIQEVAK